MQFIIKTAPEELRRARKWWMDLEMQWKFAYNEAIFGKGPTIEPPKDDELMILLVRADTLRFAGPMAVQPNLSTKLTNLSGLIPLYHLFYLSLSDCDITSLEPLVRHTKIEHLFLYNNKIKSLKGIEGMTNLKDLYVQNNELTDIKAVKKLTKLETFYCSSNQLTSLKGMTKHHAANRIKFYVLPNEELMDKDIIKMENKLGIKCRKG